MKKILSIIAITIIAVGLFSCAGSSKEKPEVKCLNSKGDIYTKGDMQRIASSFTFSPNDAQLVDVIEVQVGGHLYIVVTSTQTRSTQRPGGVSIIHSAGCNCGKK